ncbi:unnamed protein product [Meloidogyne enterolobii]|uniref:Uncharacterized protein n=1 Tax=Meloidogyne enterolobii TaxID=390850 RepID=A0ACB0YGZ0_MELEN
MDALHYSTIKYLIENSQKIKDFFEEYANTEDEEDANKSKNRLYSLIGNELGNLQIEYPILIPFGKMGSNYQWYLYNKILLLEENNEEELLTNEELEKSIKAEIRINASLLLATFERIYDQLEGEFDDKTNENYLKLKEIIKNIKKEFFDLIKKRIEIANCFICVYTSLIDDVDLDEGLDDEKIETLIEKLEEMVFKETIKVCENSWATKEGKEQILKKQRRIIENEHLSDLRHYLENNQKEKEKLTKSFKSKFILGNLIIDNERFFKLNSELKLLDILEGMEIIK